jgi:hypothetical protein
VGLSTLRMDDLPVSVVLLHDLCQLPDDPVQTALVYQRTASEEALQEGVPPL